MSAPPPSYPYHASSLQPGTVSLVPSSVRRILDLGGGRGGNGARIKVLRNADFLCTADVSIHALRNCVPGVDATAVCDIESAASLEALFQNYGPFDLVLCLDVLEHLVDPWLAVARIHELLPINGFLLASVPNVQNYRAIFRAVTGSWRYKAEGLFDRTHLRYFGRRAAIDLLTCSGLALCGLGRTFGPARRDIILNTATAGLFAAFLTMQHQILVRKTTEEVLDPGFCGSARATV